MPSVPTRLYSSLSSSSTSDCFLLDWDCGCIVDTVAWRTKIAYQVAQQVWPELRDDVMEATEAMASASLPKGNDQPTSWLTNKLEAIAPVLQEDTTDFSATAQYVLAVRLLLEEQALDQGRSPGTGKYGSLYHPQRQEPAVEKRQNASGSRPLTVNEVMANWNEYLLDTLPIKYKVRPSDLEQAIQEYSQDHDILFSSINTGTMALLASLAHRTGSLPIVTVRHAQDVAAAQQVLSHHFRESDIQILAPQGGSFPNQETPAIFVSHKTRRTVKSILEEHPSSKTLQVVESSWHALQWEMPLVDVHPGLPQEGPHLQLIAWCPKRPSLERQATMSPWCQGGACTSVNQLEEQLGLSYVAFE